MVNPYQPPAADADEAVVSEADDGDYVLANNGLRLLNLILDYVGFIAFLFMIVWVLALVGLAAEVKEELSNQLVSLTVYALYYFGCEVLFGRTPAKFVTGTKVVDVEGGSPRWTQILGRTLARFVPFEPFSFLGSRPGWHDRWSSTRVIRTRGVNVGSGAVREQVKKKKKKKTTELSGPTM